MRRRVVLVSDEVRYKEGMQNDESDDIDRS